MNTVNIIGTITKDIELKETSNEIKYTNFSIAVNRTAKNENGEYETDFFNVVAWRKTAEFIKNYFGKGKRIAISGKLQNSNYTTENGEKKTVTKIVANEVFLIEKKEKETTKENPIVEEKSMSDEVFANFGDSIEIDDDDIAF